MPLFKLSNLKSFDTDHRRRCEDQTQIQRRSKHQREHGHEQIYNAGSYLLTVTLKTYNRHKTQKDSSRIHTSAPALCRTQHTFPLSYLFSHLGGSVYCAFQTAEQHKQGEAFLTYFDVGKSIWQFGLLMTAFYFIVRSVLNNFQFVQGIKESNKCTYFNVHILYYMYLAKSPERRFVKGRQKPKMTFKQTDQIGLLLV